MWHREFWGEDGITKHQIVDDNGNVIISWERMLVLSDEFVNSICRLHNMDIYEKLKGNIKYLCA